MMKARRSIFLWSGLISLLLAGSASAQGTDADPDKYSFPELQEISRIEPIGLDIGGIDASPMSNFRRSYFVDERAFVLQISRSGRYYLGILNMPSIFTGRCSRRPEALARLGGSYFLVCGRKSQPVERLFIVEGTEQLQEITERLQE